MVPEYYAISALPNWLFNIHHAFNAFSLCTNGVRLSVGLLSRMINMSKITHSSFPLHFLRILIPLVRNSVMLNLSLVHFHAYILHVLFALSFSIYISTNHVNFLSFDNRELKAATCLSRLRQPEVDFLHS